eukprot:848741-Prymnesium_polylepis.1
MLSVAHASVQDAWFPLDALSPPSVHICAPSGSRWQSIAGLFVHSLRPPVCPSPPTRQSPAPSSSLPGCNSASSD